MTIMPKARASGPISETEAAGLFADLEPVPALVLAVSGGPDSTALLVLMARWRARLRRGPRLIAVTVDHGLRPQGRREAAAVKRLAGRLGVPHRTVRWLGDKPQTAIQEAARAARYALLAREAVRHGASHVATGHTLDDQAETVLFRLARGSGIAGLAGMAPQRPLERRGGGTGPELILVRPFLTVPKARLIATLEAAGIGFATDPSNHETRFARPRLRRSMAILAEEGLDAPGLARLAGRAGRADRALDWAADALAARLPPGAWRPGGPITFASAEFLAWPCEIALRLLQRAVAEAGGGGPVELGKLETLLRALQAAPTGTKLRRTLAGAVITRSGPRLTIERAAPRRRAAAPAGRSGAAGR